MSSSVLIQQLAQRARVLLARYEALRTEHQQLRTRLLQAEQERDALRARMEEARERVDALLGRLPGEPAPAPSRESSETES